jgi:ribose transport system substrate-binding protein
MKKTVGHVAVLVVLLLLATMVTACAQQPSASSDSGTREEELYSMVVFQKGSEYFNWCYAGFVAAAEAIGPHVKTELQGPAEADASLEAKTINQLLAKKPNGIAVTAADSATLTPSIDSAIDAVIPVITFDSDSPDSKRLTYLGTDNYLFGAAAADYIGEVCGGEGEVIVVYVPGFISLEERAEGFETRLTEAYPNMKINAFLNGEVDAVKGEQVCTAQLQANPNIKAIFCTEGITGPGAQAAVRTVGRSGEVTIVAGDFGSAVLELLKEGEIQATVVDDPYMMGYQAMLEMYAAAHPTEILSVNAPFGHVPTSNILFGSSLLTTEDINNPDVAKKYENPPQF